MLFVAEPSSRTEEKLHQAVFQHCGRPHQSKTGDLTGSAQKQRARAVQRHLHLHVVQVAPHHRLLFTRVARLFPVSDPFWCVWCLLQRIVRWQRDVSEWRCDAKEHFRPVGQHHRHERVRCALSCAALHRPQDPCGKESATSSPCWRKFFWHTPFF